MRSLTAPFLALVLAGAGALPAAASTLPPLPQKAGQSTVSLGVPDANYDYAFTDSLSVGVSALYFPPGFASPGLVAAPRLSYRFFGSDDDFALGATLSAGYFENVGYGTQTPSRMLWVQPAINASIALGPVVRVRCTLGPALLENTDFTNGMVLPLPNVEVAFKLHPQHELTLGGNSLVGWRGRF